MKFTSRPRRSKVIINITSLIDVLFLLLIFFMVSSTFLEQSGMKLELPSSKSHTTTERKDLTLFVGATGELSLNGQVVTMETLAASLQDRLAEAEEPILIIKADQEVSHGLVVRIMDISRQSGIKRLVIATKAEQ